MAATIDIITPRLTCKTERLLTGTFRTYMLDGKPVLRRDRGYEWFNHEKGEVYIDCRTTGSYDRTISREEFDRLLDGYRKQTAADCFFIETYTMPYTMLLGCKWWIKANSFPSMFDEEKCYSIWNDMVSEFKKSYPRARMSRNMNRRSVESAYNDRESSICNREWLIHSKDGHSWKYRVTMYVKKSA